MENKVVVVSGGTKGIGKSIVEKFAANGFRVFTCARNEADLEALKSKFSENGQIETFRSDLSIKEEVIGFVEFITARTSHVDVLVNNTGVFMPGNICEEEEGMLELMINTNLYSAYHLTRGLIKGMIERKSGDIFNICSIASKKAYANGGSYCISKFAMHGMTLSLREELKEHDIRVTSVLPGATLTASWDGIDLPEDRFIKPSDVSESIWSTHQLSKNTVIEELIIRPQLGDI